MKRFRFPSEFDVDIYRTLHDDLATMSVEQAVHHYSEFGEDEGRRSHSLSDRMQFGQLAPERTLEIGPFAFHVYVVRRSSMRTSIQLRNFVILLRLQASIPTRSQRFITSLNPQIFLRSEGDLMEFSQAT